MAGGATTAAERNGKSLSLATLCSAQTHSESLMSGLNKLRCAEQLFDVTLIVENRAFKAHRVVLAACSDYFCAMFTDAMLESRQSEITLNGVSARGIELLLEYAYTAQLELDPSNVQDMLSVSTHVQMRAVIDACSIYLESQIDLENCVGIAALADLYSLEALRKKTYRFMCSRLAEFSTTPDLLTLTLDQMEQILSCNYPVDCSEERVLHITTDYCLGVGIKPEKAQRLYSQICYKQIDALALKAFKYKKRTIINADPDADDKGEEERDKGAEKKEANNAGEIKGCDVVAPALNEEGQELLEYSVYENVMLVEMLKQQDAFFAPSTSAAAAAAADNVDEVTDTRVLTNSRGMELALVKIGGFETNGLTNQISCYLPSKGKWESLTVIPHIEQCNYGTAVLGNDLYVVGGSYDVCLKEYIHPFGFRYCATKNKWQTIAPIQADRCRFSLNAMGSNYLYAVGGVCELNENDGNGDLWANDMAISNCERYDAKADRWEYLPPLAENRSQHAGTVHGEHLFISGGMDRHIVLSTFWCYDTVEGKWHKLQPMPTPRADHVLLTIDAQIYACGGWYEDPTSEMRVLADTIDVYDIDRDRWRTETINPLPKYYTGVAVVKRKIYFIGGLLSTATINRATAAVQCYDLATQKWSFNMDWEYPKEVWECTCASFYVPRERDDTNVKYQWGNS